MLATSKADKLGGPNKSEPGSAPGSTILPCLASTVMNRKLLAQERRELKCACRGASSSLSFFTLRFSSLTRASCLCTLFSFFPSNVRIFVIKSPYQRRREERKHRLSLLQKFFSACCFGVSCDHLTC